MIGVSVVMPARNAARTISASIQSILAQPSVIELLVVDDHSIDGTAQIAQKTGDARVLILPSPECGIAAALNHGLSKATGDYLARCDADDLYPEGRLDWQLSWLTSHCDYMAVSGGFRAISARGKPIADLACEGIGRDVTPELLAGNTITTLCSWLIRIQAAREVGGARRWFETGEDVDLQLRLAHLGKIWHEPRVSYLYRIHDYSVTHRQKGDVRRFYELSARRFAQQRAQRGYDDLDANLSPPRPDSDDSIRKSANEHSISLLVGAAWSQHRQGKTISALRRMVSAIRLNPLRLSLWKGLAMLIVKVRR